MKSFKNNSTWQPMMEEEQHKEPKRRLSDEQQLLLTIKKMSKEAKHGLTLMGMNSTEQQILSRRRTSNNRNRRSNSNLKPIRPNQSLEDLGTTRRELSFNDSSNNNNDSWDDMTGRSKSLGSSAFSSSNLRNLLRGSSYSKLDDSLTNNTRSTTSSSLSSRNAMW